jgi:hypothetical protein
MDKNRQEQNKPQQASNDPNQGQGGTPEEQPGKKNTQQKFPKKEHAAQGTERSGTK